MIVATVAAVEFFFRLPFLERVRDLSGLVAKTVHTVRSPRISDHWKEKVLLAYSGKLMATSILLFLMILVIMVPVAIAGGIGVLTSWPVAERFASLAGVGLSVLVAFGYLFVRRQVIGE